MQQWFEAPLPTEDELKAASDKTYAGLDALPSYENLLREHEKYAEKVDAFLSRYGLQPLP